jgi:hypothetical protein
MMNDKWSEKWPTKEDTYWFYGKQFRDSQTKLHLVEVWIDGVGNPTYVTEGSFMYKQEGAVGLWMKANLPWLPVADFELFTKKEGKNG